MARITAKQLGLGGVFFAAVAMLREMRILHREARQDPLTGLPNRRCLPSAWRAIPSPKALLFIDLVGFKLVNDLHGHLVGDQLLKNVAGHLTQWVGRPSTLVRWGGDEFVLVATEPSAIELAKRLEEMGSFHFDLDGVDQSCPIGLSLGLATGVDNLDAALAEANRRMMGAKSGRQKAQFIHASFGS